MVENASDVAKKVMNVEAVNSIDRATAPSAPSGPKRTLYVAVAALAGFFAAIVVVVVDMLNTKIRGQHDLEKIVPVPVIGTVLNCCDAVTSGHYYGYYKERRNDSYDVVAPSADVAQPLGAAPASASVAPVRPASNRVSSSVSGPRSPRLIPAGGVATCVKPVNSSVRSQRAAGQNGLDQTSFLKQAGYAPRIPHEEE